ncbi:hypothetical protein Pelo_6776 [Pelomyxa schiedti]|nr:hypothetical protein Pelo_6776 [Pelomyxa schiedti]
MALSYYAKNYSSGLECNIRWHCAQKQLLIGISVLPAKNPPPSPQRQQLTHASSAAGSIGGGGSRSALPIGYYLVDSDCVVCNRSWIAAARGDEICPLCGSATINAVTDIPGVGMSLLPLAHGRFGEGGHARDRSHNLSVFAISDERLKPLNKKTMQPTHKRSPPCSPTIPVPHVPAPYGDQCHPTAPAPLLRQGRCGKVVAVKPPAPCSRSQCITMGDQVLALVMGTHPRCGAGCPLWSMSPAAAAAPVGPAGGDSCGGGGGLDGSLVPRTLWMWLVAHSRLYCVTWTSRAPRGGLSTVTATFGVSSALLTLTHGMRWWERGTCVSLGANDDYFVAVHRSLFVLQDRLTGERRALFDSTGCWWVKLCSNRKWFVVFDQWKMVAFEIPRRNPSGPTTIKKPTVVPLGSLMGSSSYSPEFGGGNEDHILLCDYSSASQFQFILVDVAQTTASKTLAVLSSTVPRLNDLQLPRSEPFIFRSFLVMTHKGGARSFVTGGSFKDPAGIIVIEEGTGKVKGPLGGYETSNFCPTWCVSQLNQSQFCVTCTARDTYDVWDINDISRPARTQKFATGNPKRHDFMEGGLLFQLKRPHSMLKEIKVTEEASGTHVVTFQLFRPVLAFTNHFSCRQPDNL